MGNNNITIKAKLEILVRFVQQRDYENALKLCDEIIAEDSSIYEAYSERSRALHQLGRDAEAFCDLKTLIDLRPKSPSAYLRRARWNLELGHNQPAVNDLTFVINSGDQYFLNAALFYRAVAYLNLNNKDDAMKDGLKLSEDFSFYVKTRSHGEQHLSRKDILKLASQE